MLIKDTELVVFDLETTGLIPSAGHRICEIGAVKIKGNGIISSFQSLVNPKRDIPPETVAIHGITTQQVSQSPFFEEVIERFLEFLGRAPLLAYNIRFDLSFLDYQIKLMNKDCIDNKCIDVLAMCRNILNYLPKYNLSYIADFLNLQYSVRHRAYKDAETAAFVFQRLISILEEKSLYKFDDIFSLFGYNRNTV
jgi:DNA polymerase III subunit alpha, Gram-positive type